MTSHHASENYNSDGMDVRQDEGSRVQADFLRRGDEHAHEHLRRSHLDNGKSASCPSYEKADAHTSSSSPLARTPSFSSHFSCCSASVCFTVPYARAQDTHPVPVPLQCISTPCSRTSTRGRNSANRRRATTTSCSPSRSPSLSAAARTMLCTPCRTARPGP